MTRVLALATSKGGTGKTTIAVALLDWWRRAGQALAVLDTDPNQSITRWLGKSSVFADVTVCPCPQEHEIVPTVRDLAAVVDTVIIDTAGFSNQAMIFAVGVSDLVLTPVLADEASLYEAVRMRQVVTSAADLTGRTIAFHTLVNRSRRTLVERHMAKQLDALGLNPLKARVSDRAAFQEASYHGLSPAGLMMGGKAWDDIRRVARELDKRLPVAGPT